jgi:hypothetical protein
MCVLSIELEMDLTKKLNNIEVICSIFETQTKNKKEKSQAHQHKSRSFLPSQFPGG